MQNQQSEVMQVRCSCGTVVLLDPALHGIKVRCHACGREVSPPASLARNGHRPGELAASLLPAAAAAAAALLMLGVLVWALAYPEVQTPGGDDGTGVIATPKPTDQPPQADPGVAKGGGGDSSPGASPAGPTATTAGPPSPEPSPETRTEVAPAAEPQPEGDAPLPVLQHVPGFRTPDTTAGAQVPTPAPGTKAVDVDAVLAAAAKLKQRGAAAGSGTSVGIYDLRSAEGRQLARAFGATAESEEAVDLGLKWLASVQQQDGHWDYRGGQHPVGATALATLAFLGAGHTHRGGGPYRDSVDRALNWLMARQTKDGCFQVSNFYSQGLATMALCEALGMTKDGRLYRPAADALQCILSKMGPDGGFGYGGLGDDTHVTSFQVMGIKSARLVNLRVDAQHIQRLVAYYDQALNPDATTNYGVRSTHPTPARTALGLFCRLMLGLSRKHPTVVRIATLLHTTGPLISNYFQTYYGTYAMFQMQGDYWLPWNDKMRDPVIAQQIKAGDNRGSWNGEVVETAVRLMTLEVYYRYLPVNQ